MKKILLLSIVFTSILGMAQVPTNGLVGYWSFGNNLNDLSGNGNDGTTNGCVFATDRFGNPNSCVEFDGVDDIITIPHSASIDFDSFTESFTISFWFRSNNPIISGEESSARFIEKWDGINSNNYSHNIIIYTDYIKTQIYDGNTSSQTIAQGYFNDKWYNLTLVNNVLTDSVSLYIDGVLKERVVNNSTSSTNNQNDLLFGNTIGLIRPYSGLMDDIRFFDRVLEQTEITEIVTETTTKISDLQVNNFIEIYPNPANSMITINGDNISKIEIIDINGKIVYQTNENKKNIDISDYVKGIYFVKIFTRKGIEIKKILIK